METKQILDCLIEAGIVSPNRGSQLTQVISKLGASNSDALKVIAAASIIPSGASEQVPVAIEAFAGVSGVRSLNPPSEATLALITVVGINNIIFRVDGGDPTTSMGHVAKSKDNFTIAFPQISSFKFIQETGTVDVFVTYF